MWETSGLVHEGKYEKVSQGSYSLIDNISFTVQKYPIVTDPIPVRISSHLFSVAEVEEICLCFISLLFPSKRYLFNNRLNQHLKFDHIQSFLPQIPHLQLLVISSLYNHAILLWFLQTFAAYLSA
jgi:hypothetical protein